MSDEGLMFQATVLGFDGLPITQRTYRRVDLLTWIEQQQNEGADLLEIQMTARGVALSNMLAALAFGAARDPQ